MEYDVDMDMINEFLVYVKEKGFEVNSKEYCLVILEIKCLFKVRLVKYLFGDEGFYSIWNDGDLMVWKVLEVL